MGETCDSPVIHREFCISPRRRNEKQVVAKGGVLLIFPIDSPPCIAKDPGMKTLRTALILLITSMALGTASAEPVFRHFVSFQFKEGTSAEQQQELVDAFLKLKSEIDGIIDLEWGGTENIEPLNDGFTHSFLVTFKDKAGLAAYLPHPAHEAFVAKLKPHLEKVYVFDYTAKK